MTLEMFQLWAKQWPNLPLRIFGQQQLKNKLCNNLQPGIFRRKLIRNRWWCLEQGRIVLVKSNCPLNLRIKRIRFMIKTKIKRDWEYEFL